MYKKNKKLSPPITDINSNPYERACALTGPNGWAGVAVLIKITKYFRHLSSVVVYCTQCPLSPRRRPPREGRPRFFPPTFTHCCALDGGGRALSGNIDHKSAVHAEQRDTTEMDDKNAYS